MHPIRLLLIVTALALASASAASAYSWPFRPFDAQHPIRGFFGDPRTVYDNGVLAGAFEGPGVFSFHQGIDIAAPDGTPIYPSENGTAHYLGASTLNVVTDHDVVFQYFHIVTVVGEGQPVVARRTVLGYVQAPFGHVHITEIDGTKVVNPLQRGHLEPYAGDPILTLNEAFGRLTPGRQKSYIYHIASAKQSATRAARVEKCVPKILAGKGLSD